jgi:hypothetical protein
MSDRGRLITSVLLLIFSIVVDMAVPVFTVVPYRHRDIVRQSPKHDSVLKSVHSDIVFHLNSLLVLGASALT